jgi:hypothetical protein
MSVSQLRALETKKDKQKNTTWKKINHGVGKRRQN